MTAFIENVFSEKNKKTERTNHHQHCDFQFCCSLDFNFPQ